MAVEITFLGTGGAFTDFRVNYHNNAVVHTDEGVVLIDCGVQSLKELGMSVHNVAGVIVTHMHGDHIGGIEQLLWERYYTPDPNSASPLPEFKPTTVFAPGVIHAALRRSLTDCVDEMTGPEGYAVHGGYDLLVRTCYLESKSFGMSCGNVAFNLYPQKHVESDTMGVHKPCFGVRVQEPGKGGGFYFTSDTVFDPALYEAEHVQKSDVVFHDCTFSPEYPGTVHTHYTQLLALPAEHKAKTVLMHHTQVPDSIDVEADGFMGAADRHQSFVMGDSNAQ